MEKVNVVPYAREHCDGLAALLREWGTDRDFTREQLSSDLERIFAHPEYRICIALYRGAVAGYAQTADKALLCFDPFVEVEQLLVAEEFRSRGIGAALMQHIEEDARSRGLMTVKLCSQVQRSRAHVFYERLGYQYFKISKFYEKKLEQ